LIKLCELCANLCAFAAKNMKNLPEILKKENYKKIKFKVSKTQHLLIKATINGVNGNFILDTGASNSCVGFESIELFQLSAGKSKTKASGAGASGMFTQLAKNNMLQLGTWKKTDFSLVIFDLSHVNAALEEHKVKPVHGIIGADILLLGEGIIDYFNKYLYLKYV
jgi:predicted aspartyl protease